MSEAGAGRLPVHGFVLAGGKSSRMGRDKALLEFRGRPMVEIAVGKLRGFCAEVSIAGNREDLGGFAPVVGERLLDAGPVAGIEAGVRACAEPWALFMPVDVPLVPAALLRGWAEAVLEKGCAASFLLANGERQPAFCMLRRSVAPVVMRLIEAGERRVGALLYGVAEAGEGWLWVAEAAEFSAGTECMERWFGNVNTPEELAEAEGWGDLAG